MPELPKAPLKRIMKRKGAERVSSNAVQTFRSTLENVAKEMTESALEKVESDGRKTLKKRDINGVK